jgi:hypothetical protein
LINEQGVLSPWQSISDFESNDYFVTLLIKKLLCNQLLVMTNQYVKYKDFVIKSYLDNERKLYFHSRTLCPSDPKINRDHLLVLTNQYVKYENFLMYSFQDKQRKSFWYWRPFDLVTPKSIRVILLVTTNHVKYEGFVMNSFQDFPCVIQ